MKIQLDTERKIIDIEGKVNIGELIEVLKKLFPNDEWKEFDIATRITLPYQPDPPSTTWLERTYTPWWDYNGTGIKP